MAKFLDKKERVIDFQLTPYGKHRLAIGKLKPAFYAFFDQGVLYDSEYAGFSEVQNNIHERIKNKTQFIEGVLSFEEVENSSPPSTFLGGAETYKYVVPSLSSDDTFTLDETRAQLISRAEIEGSLSDEELRTFLEESEYAGLYSGVSLFDLDVVPQKFIPKPKMLSFESAIGDARFEGNNTQAAPAWKIVSCQGEMSNITTKDTTRYNFSSASFDNEETEFNIPQINVDAYYTKLITKYDPSTPYFDSISENNTQTPIFADGNIIKLVKDDIVIYGEEVNTELLNENFDVEVFEIEESLSITTNSFATVTVDDAITAGDTITINDGKNSATFKFVNNVPSSGGQTAYVNSLRTEFETTGIIQVAVSNQYLLLGTSADRKGTIYNLISAIRGDNGSQLRGYPTEYSIGSKADGSVETGRGRCKSHWDPGCYIGGHSLDVSITDALIGTLLGHDLSANPFDIEITNNIVQIDLDINLPITTTAAASRISPTGFSGGFIAKTTELKRKFFANDVPQIVDGLMVTGTPTDIGAINYNPDDVNYFFNILTDSQVDTKIACACANTYNRNSYYIDIDFECDEETIPEIFYDIYGSVTSPEVCEPEEPPDNCSDRE